MLNFRFDTIINIESISMLNFRFNAIINIESISINLSISFCPSPENRPFGGKICDFVELFKINQRDAIIRPRKVAKIFWFQIGV